MRTVVAIVMLLWGFAGTQPVVLSTEFERLARDLAVMPEANRQAFEVRLERGRTALAANHLYLALYDLQPVYEGEAGFRLAGQADKVANQAAFKARWTEMGLPAAPPAQKAPVYFIEALAQSSDGRAAATYRASLPYAADSGLVDGLYYLAESHAMARFAALCRAVEARPAGPSPSLRPVGPALNAHDARVVKAYEAAPANVRPRYAQVNVAIKLARTLDESGHPEGALLQYLVSRYRLALIQNAGTAAPSATEMASRLKAVTLPAGADHSIAEFFLQLGEAVLKGKEPAPAAAAPIVDDIIPAYLELVKK